MDSLAGDGSAGHSSGKINTKSFVSRFIKEFKTQGDSKEYRMSKELD